MSASIRRSFPPPPERAPLEPLLVLVLAYALVTIAEAFAIGEPNGPRYALQRGPWLLLRIVPFVFLYRHRTRVAAGAAVSAGLAAGQLVASLVLDPLVWSSQLAHQRSWETWLPAVLALAVFAERFGKAPHQDADAFLWRAAVGALVVVGVAVGPLVSASVFLIASHRL